MRPSGLNPENHTGVSRDVHEFVRVLCHIEDSVPEVAAAGNTSATLQFSRRSSRSERVVERVGEPLAAWNVSPYGSERLDGQAQA